MIRLRVLALLASQGLNTILVDLNNVLFDGFFDRHFNFVFFALIDVAMDIYEGSLAWRPRKEAKIAELVRSLHLGLLLMLNHGGEKLLRDCLLDVDITFFFFFDGADDVARRVELVHRSLLHRVNVFRFH